MGLLRTDSHREIKDNFGCVPFVSMFSVIWGGVLVLLYQFLRLGDSDNGQAIERRYQYVDNPTITFTRYEPSVGGTLLRAVGIILSIIMMLVGALSALGVISFIFNFLGENGLKWYYLLAIQIPIIILGASRLTLYRCAVRNADGKSDEWLYLITLVLTVVATIAIVGKMYDDGLVSDDSDWWLYSSPVAGFVVYHLLTKTVLTSILVVFYKLFVKADTEEAKEYIAHLNEVKAKKDSEIAADINSPFSFKKVLGMVSVVAMVFTPCVLMYFALNPELLMAKVQGTPSYLMGYQLAIQELFLNTAKAVIMIYVAVLGLALIFSSVNSIFFVGAVNRLVPVGKIITSLVGLGFIYASAVVIPNTFYGEGEVNAGYLRVQTFNYDEVYDKAVYLNDSVATPISELTLSLQQDKEEFLSLIKKDKKKRNEYTDGRDDIEYGNGQFRSGIILLSTIPLMMYIVYKLVGVSRRSTKVCSVITYIFLVGVFYVWSSMRFDETTMVTQLVSGAASHDTIYGVDDVAVKSYLGVEVPILPVSNVNRIVVTKEYHPKDHKKKSTTTVVSEIKL